MNTDQKNTELDSTPHPSPLPGRGGEGDGGRSATRPTGDGRWSVAQQMEERRADQAYLRLQAEVRQVARAQGMNRAEAEALAEQSRAAFRIVNGEAQAVGSDGRTALRDGTGALLSVGAWVERHLTPALSPKGGEGARLHGTFGPTPVPLPVRLKNPFARGSWNLTEQMRLQRRDPELAARLRDEAGN